VSGDGDRPGVIRRAFRRWQTRLVERLLGWAFPLVVVALAAVWLARRPRVAAPLTAAAVAAYAWHRWGWVPFAVLAALALATLAVPRVREVAHVRARRAAFRTVALVVDPLRWTVQPPQPRDPVDLSALRLGRRDNGDPVPFALWRPGRGSTHLLVAGVTGAGKGSAVWGLLSEVGPAIRDGFVSVWAADPKGGAELGGGEPLFDRFVCGGSTAGEAWQTAIADLLDDAVAGMQARLASMRDPQRPGGPVRWHTPTEAEPLILVVVDEVSAITAYAPPAIRARIDNSLSLLLSQGRAAAVSVVLCTQDPRVETLRFRALIPERIALRTADPAADLILGPGMRARGALTERINRRLPGVGYLLDERSADPVRFRLPYVSDAQVVDLAARYRRRPPVAEEPYRTPATRVAA
jgi:S-DNA-T family DNA segregation ATPase FtsK/SpoIIIE